MIHPVERRRVASLMLVMLLAPTFVRAGDWPQLLGPTRNGQAIGESLPDHFPDNFTAKLSYSLGAGYAGPAVAGEQIVVFHRIDDLERVEVLSAKTGQPLWHVDFPAEYQGGYNPDTGPRCVPLVHGGRAFVFGASGRLHCVDLAQGKPVWSRSLGEDYRAPEGYFGAGSTPILAENKVLVTLGGRSGAGIVAVDAATGENAWKATDEQVSYGSPTTAELHGQPYWLMLTRLNLLAINPHNGKVLFSHPFGDRGLSVTGTTPIVFDDYIFLSASYNIGAELLHLKANGDVESVWKSDDVLSSQYTSSVYRDGFLYGTHGREDVGRAELRCVDAKTGKVRWHKPDCGVAHVILAGDRILMVEVQTGNVVLLAANSERYEELDRKKVTSDPLRALPALAHGVLYVRTTHGDSGGQLLGFPLN
jgi:outer membrane protein assembly factor BamB